MPQLKIEPTSFGEYGPGLDFPGAYPYSPSTLEPGPSFKECLDAAAHYFPSQQDLQRITHNASSTVRGYIPPYPATQEAIAVSPIEESETTPTAAGSFVLIHRGTSATPTSTSTRGNHDDSIQPDIKDNALEPQSPTSGILTRESPPQVHPTPAKEIAVSETQITFTQPDTHPSESTQPPNRPTNADHDRNKVDTKSHHSHSLEDKEPQSQEGPPIGLGIRVGDVKNTSATETNMQKVFSSTATAGHEEGEEEEEEQGMHATASHDEGEKEEGMHVKKSMTESTSPEPSTSQIEQNPVQIEPSPPHNSHTTTPKVLLPHTAHHDQRGRKKGNFLIKIKDWSRRDRKTKPRASD